MNWIFRARAYDHHTKNITQKYEYFPKQRSLNTKNLLLVKRKWDSSYYSSSSSLYLYYYIILSIFKQHVALVLFHQWYAFQGFQFDKSSRTKLQPLKSNVAAHMSTLDDATCQQVMEHMVRCSCSCSKAAYHTDSCIHSLEYACCQPSVQSMATTCTHPTCSS